MTLQPGDPAPDFCLPDETGHTHCLRDYQGRTVVLYFYPRDNTPGCTREALGFKENHARFAAAGVAVLGVSPDDAASHQRFKAKHGLPFPLLSDPEHRVLEAYEAWGPKKMYGRTYMGVLRKTYIIGPDGHIRKIYPKVRPKGHAQQVWEDLQALGLLPEATD